MNKSPLIVTTKNDEGNEISLIDGTPLNLPQTQSTIILMTPNGTGENVPVPLRSNLISVEYPIELPVDPVDGLQACVEKANIVTTGSITALTASMIPEVFINTKIVPEDIKGTFCLFITNCVNETFSGPIMMFFCEDLSILDAGFTGAGILLVYGDADTPDKIIANLAEAQTNSLGTWLKGWSQAIVATEEHSVFDPEKLGPITNVVINAAESGGDNPLKCVSNTPFFWEPSFQYSKNGRWYNTHTQSLPCFLSYGRETQSDAVDVPLKFLNQYSLSLYGIGFMAPPTWLDIVKMIEVVWMSRAYLTRLKMPVILTDSSAIKSEYERQINLETFLLAAEPCVVSIVDWSYHSVEDAWDGKIQFTNSMTSEVYLSDVLWEYVQVRRPGN